MSGTIDKVYSTRGNTVMDIRDKSGTAKGTIHVKKFLGKLFKTVQIFKPSGERVARGFALNFGPIIQSAYLIQDADNAVIARGSITRWMTVLMRSPHYKVWVTNSNVEPQMAAFAFSTCFS